MLGHVSQINTQRISIDVYFAQLGHHQHNTDMYVTWWWWLSCLNCSYNTREISLIKRMAPFWIFRFDYGGKKQYIKLFSGYTWYTFNNKTQKNFWHIYFAQLRRIQTVLTIVRNIYGKFFCVFETWPSIPVVSAIYNVSPPTIIYICETDRLYKEKKIICRGAKIKLINRKQEIIRMSECKGWGKLKITHLRRSGLSYK